MSEEQKQAKIYLIERFGTNDDCRYYAEHGEMGGVSDAIGYDCIAHARKFRTEEDAQQFIRTELPEWGRELHKPIGLGMIDFFGVVAEISIMLRYGAEIPDDLLEPTAGRLRIWRC